MVALPEQSPGQTMLDDFIDITEEEVAEHAHSVEVHADAPPQRQVLVLPGEYMVADTYVETQGGQFGELAYATPVHGGSVFLDRSQLIAVGSAMLQLAGKMTPPKIVKQQQAEAAAEESGLVVAVRDKTLIDPAGKPLTSADLRV